MEVHTDRQPLPSASEVLLWERLLSGNFQAFLAGKSKPSELLLKTLFNNERSVPPPNTHTIPSPHVEAENKLTQ